MGVLLREALRMLCGMNQWSYAVFWKIGNQNSELLIWEECYYETAASQLGYQSWDRLIEKMMMNNQINLVGQGLVGRAAFVGSHQWILANSFTRDTHPPEVLNEVHPQFSAGMQTIAVIPVLPHGVIQLGSCQHIMENVGFINDVKSLIHQLGCIPGALLSNSCETNEFAERIGIPISLGAPVSIDSSGVLGAANSSPLSTNSFNQRSNPLEASRLLGSSSFPVYQIGNRQEANALASQLPILSQTLAETHEEHREPKCTPENDLFQAINRLSMHADDCGMLTDANYEVASVKTSSGSGNDLFDVVGAEFKKTLLDGKWNNVHADGQNVNTGKFGHAFSANEGLSDRSIHPGIDTDHLLDAVVSSSNSASKQISDDDRSCMSTTTKISSYSLVEQRQNSGRNAKKNNGITKPNRKRLKPEENPRPRPKDRQLIQDRVKELREIIPNGAKCSIDALLEKTIKHMLFMQSVAKNADNLKHTGAPKIISKDEGVILKDNFDGGATWAFEVGSQSMVCPIIVEDLNPPRQMLVEMICEERGYFLDIADLIRKMGLTILKGVMEHRNNKIWARFAVEANRDVTRVEIFMSLVRLIDQITEGNAALASPLEANVEGTLMIPATS